ncbi:hypothetical protein H6P81_021327 [Aristolochia fimbriata]|uniref:Senescence-associated protein n=1 Tax=Aristolochia fimbriata TaxID=158543 RepID=A0AAV7DTY5_ARIFI|nr:hypothetical protein H6P81_021327 [Aristolochia fimbriata]
MGRFVARLSPAGCTGGEAGCDSAPDRPVRTRGRDESVRHGAESRWIVAARPLCHYNTRQRILSRAQRIQIAARSGIVLQAPPSTRPPARRRLRPRALGGGRPLAWVGKRRRRRKSRHRRIKKQRRYERLGCHKPVIPCGNFYDTSSFKFRRSKGSIGPAFAVRIRTENLDQASFCPFALREVSVLTELALGHLRYLLTDVRPAKLPTDNVFRRIISPGEQTEQKEGQCPPPTNGISTSSESAVRAGEGPKGGVPDPSPARRGDQLSPGGNASSSPPTARRVGTGTPCQPLEPIFFESYGSILPTSLAYIVPSTRGCSPWRPDAVMIRPGVGGTFGPPVFKGPGYPDTCSGVACSSRWTLPPAERFQGGQAVKQKR